MNDLADFRRANNKKYTQIFPEGILDVIKIDYPSKYLMILEEPTRLAALFSNEEWFDILTKSRNSYRFLIHQINLSRKYLLQGN